MSTENKFKNLLAATKSESILAVIAGLPVDATGHFIDETQMGALIETLDANASAIASHQATLDALNAQMTSATAERDAATTALATATSSITAKDSEIVKLQAQVKKLEEGTEDPKQTQSAADKTGGGKVASWADPKNPANMAAAKYFGTVKETKK